MHQLGPKTENISIHALLAESDKECTSLAPKPKTFLSTLSLRRATNVYRDSAASHPKFLSTLSLRRATHRQFPRQSPEKYFYPRSPCGERLRGGLWVLLTQIFLSTLSLRRATGKVKVVEPGLANISIHALLAESDSKSAQNSGALLRI